MSTPSSGAHYVPNNTVLTLCGDLTAGAGLRPRRALLRRAAGRRLRGARPPQLEPLAEPVRVDRARSSPTTGSTSRSACPSTRPTSSSPWPSRSTASAGSRPRAWCGGSCGASRRRSVPTPRRGASSTAPRSASSCSTSHPGTTPTPSRPPSSRSCDGLLRPTARPRSSSSVARAVRAVAGCPPGQPGGARRPHQPPPPAPRRPGGRQHLPRPPARGDGRPGARRRPAWLRPRAGRWWPTSSPRMPAPKSTARTSTGTRRRARPPSRRPWHERGPSRRHPAAAVVVPRAVEHLLGNGVGWWRTTSRASTSSPCGSSCPPPCPTSRRARRAWRHHRTPTRRGHLRHGPRSSPS